MPLNSERVSFADKAQGAVMKVDWCMLVEVMATTDEEITDPRGWPFSLRYECDPE